MATSTLQTNAAHDLFLPDGKNLVLLTGIAAVEQSVVATTLMRKGEDIYNTSTGVDYFGTIFTSQMNETAARASIVSAITASPDVTSVEDLTINVEGDVFSFVAKINTIYGPTQVGGSTA